MDKTYDKSHRLHAMHFNIDLVVITTLSVYCDHKEKQQQANRQTKQQTSKPKKQMKKRKEKKTKNKQKKSHRVRTLDLTMSSPWRNPSATQIFGNLNIFMTKS